MDTLKQIFEVLMYAIITGCAVVVVKKVFIALNAKVDEWQVNTKLHEYETLNKYIDYAQDAIYTAVITITQTYVDDVKKSGSWNDDAKLIAKNNAINLAKEMITEESKNAITSVFGDFETYLVSMIETIVKQSK